MASGVSARPSSPPAPRRTISFSRSMTSKDRSGRTCDHDHVDGVGADVDGGDAHRSALTIMKRFAPVTDHARSPTVARNCSKPASTGSPACCRASRRATSRALHRARVASRRLRELLPVLQLDARRHAQAQPAAAQSHDAARRRSASSTCCCSVDELHVSRRRARGRVDARRRRRREGARRGAEATCAERLPHRRAERAGAQARPGRAGAATRRGQSGGAPRAGAVADWRVGDRRARRAARVAPREAIDRRRRGVSARAAARRAHRGQETALRARAVAERRATGPRTGVARAEARPGPARPHARSAGADRSRAPGAGVADAAQPRRSGATSTRSSCRSRTTAGGCTRATCERESSLEAARASA